MPTGTSRDTGHGRIGVRPPTRPTWLAGSADGPRLGQVFRIERQRRVRG